MSNWAGQAVAEALGLDISDNAIQQRQSDLSTWIKSGAPKIDHQHDSRNGRDKPMVVVGERALTGSHACRSAP